MNCNSTESSGVDVDVRTDLVSTVLVVSDDTALLPGATPRTETDAVKVASFQKSLARWAQPTSTRSRRR